MCALPMRSVEHFGQADRHQVTRVNSVVASVRRGSAGESCPRDVSKYYSVGAMLHRIHSSPTKMDTPSAVFAVFHTIDLMIMRCSSRTLPRTHEEETNFGEQYIRGGYRNDMLQEAAV